MKPSSTSRRGRAALILPLAAAMLCACAPVPPSPGQARDALLAAWGTPTGRYALPGGGERLEYATGPFGRMTWMVDVDAAGRVATSTQVLNEANFAELQGKAAGMSRDELLRTLGRPGERQGAGLRGGEIWSWRYPTNDCLWFQVTVDTAAGRVRDAGYGIDPWCDSRSGDKD